MDMDNKVGESAPSINPPPRHHAPFPLRCDCCKNPISDGIHAQNNPCGHNICFPCFMKANMKRGANPDFCQVRDCSQQFITSCQYFNRGVPGEFIENESALELGTDEVAWILSFLPLEKIMCLRRVNKTWNEAAKITIVPSTDFRVNNLQKYRAMRVMARVLPNLQQITLGSFGIRHKYNDGEDPFEWWADRTADYTTHDIEIISNFSKLRVLTLWNADVNGRYPFLFNSFPLLQTLSIQYCGNLKWDLEMLVGFPVLKELICCENHHDMTGNISSLRVLKDTLETVYITGCVNVEGNFMDLADLPNLIELNLFDTAVTGDIRDIGENDYSSLEHLILPERVYGAKGYELQRISDAPDLVRTVYRLKKQRPALEMQEQDMDQDWYGKLSDDSPDWYDTVEEDDDDDDTPPFFIYFVKAGLRVGYWWRTEDGKPCEVNWLHPEPDRDSSDYAKYIEELQEINNKVNMFMYKGFHQPPTEEEYNRLCEEYR